MWKLKQLIPKEPAGLEGRSIDVGNLKLLVQKPIAEGGFSCVYSARDASNFSKQYALKHMICNDDESLEIAVKEISVMNTLRGNPNIVTLHSHAVFDTGRTKEVLLAMEFCDKSLVGALENRGAGYFEEKQALSIFSDACHAVYAMHSQSPPIAHRDLKPENILLGSDGKWKLCDFGSTTTNHKRFEKADEMGIEEDNIRKCTTPAFRSPELWDLYRREFISEKVDIWALGCLLYRLLYLKNAFDGESKLQVLNGNYRVPEMPKYSPAAVGLIRDMLRSSPDDRPDIMQILTRVNDLLPSDLKKSLPEYSPANVSGWKPASRPQGGGNSGSRGAFWSSQHAKETVVEEDRTVEINPTAEIAKLRNELKIVNSEKAEILSKFEKLSAICKYQRQEIQDLKNAVATKTSPSGSLIGGESLTWNAFGEEPKVQENVGSKAPHSVRSGNGSQKKPAASEFESWGFVSDSFVVRSGSTPVSKPESNGSRGTATQPSGQQPAGWAGF